MYTMRKERRKERGKERRKEERKDEKKKGKKKINACFCTWKENITYETACRLLIITSLSFAS